MPENRALGLTRPELETLALRQRLPAEPAPGVIARRSGVAGRSPAGLSRRRAVSTWRRAQALALPFRWTAQLSSEPWATVSSTGASASGSRFRSSPAATASCNRPVTARSFEVSTARVSRRKVGVGEVHLEEAWFAISSGVDAIRANPSRNSRRAASDEVVTLAKAGARVLVAAPGEHVGRLSQAPPVKFTGDARVKRSDHDAFDLVDRHPVRRSVVEFRRLGRPMPGDLLGVLEGPTVRQIRRDPRRPERVAARRGREPRCGRPALDHGEHHPPRERPPGQPLPCPVHALKQRLPRLLAPASLKVRVDCGSGYLDRVTISRRLVLSVRRISIDILADRRLHPTFCDSVASFLLHRSPHHPGRASPMDTAPPDDPSLATAVPAT